MEVTSLLQWINSFLFHILSFLWSSFIFHLQASHFSVLFDHQNLFPTLPTLFFLRTVLLMEFIEHVFDTPTPLMAFDSQAFHIERPTMDFFHMQVQSRITVVFFGAKTHIKLSLYGPRYFLVVPGIYFFLFLFILDLRNPSHAKKTQKLYQ